ncbi:MAG: hypothetical protein LBP78_04605, partial [Acidaminococcales bacterium]|nr:hypothetical protein [Acidaminococcales bacterium]
MAEDNVNQGMQQAPATQAAAVQGISAEAPDQARPEPAANQSPAGERGPAKAQAGESPAPELNLAPAFAGAGVAFDPAVADEYRKVLVEAGVRDNEVANRLAGFVLSQQGKALSALYEEAVKEYGGTPAEPGEKFRAAQVKAG